MWNVLITGITGSGGSYLAEHIIEKHKDVKVWGICRWHSTSVLANIENIKDKITVREADLMDISSIIRVLRDCRPDRIFHLAAYANVRKCFETPLAVINNNIMGTANLLEAVRLTCPKSLVQICSTSEVYGTPQTVPIKENHPLCPVNPYSVSKLAGESLAQCYHKSWGIDVIITRAFAYINPRRPDLFASAFAQQVVNIENGKQKVLRHGNLESIRTLIDVRDIVRAYWIACEYCKPGVPYNIGGTEPIDIGTFLFKLRQHTKSKVATELDSSLLRPVDITMQIPDTTRFVELTKWKPQYSLEESIEFLLDTYRKKSK
jgi:GDP-4-dehydro-6-deoxy-D-mannose reductase